MSSTLPITNGLVGWYKGEEWNGTWDAKVKCFLAYNRHLTSGEISALHNTLII